MSALHIRDVSPAVLAALKARADRHHRSVQGEVKCILEAALIQAEPGARRSLTLHLAEVGAPTTYRRDDIYGDNGR